MLSNGGNNGVYGSTSFGSAGSNIVDLTAAGNTAGSNVSGLAAAAAALPTGLNVGLMHKFGNFFGLGGLLQALSTVRRREHSLDA